MCVWDTHGLSFWPYVSLWPRQSHSTFEPSFPRRSILATEATFTLNGDKRIEILGMLILMFLKTIRQHLATVTDPQIIGHFCCLAGYLHFAFTFGPMLPCSPGSPGIPILPRDPVLPGSPISPSSPCSPWMPMINTLQMYSWIPQPIKRALLQQ